MANKKLRLIPLLVVSMSLIVSSLISFVTPQTAYAVTPPDRGLGAADSYAVFGKAGVTNDGASTHIWGNIGADTMSTITGLDDPSQVDGTKIAPAANVQTDASSTYGSLMSDLQGAPTDLDLAGTHTITPGVYNVAASTLNGDLTLSGAGVYIFRSSSSNTTAHSGRMILTNGACASNVFWAISTSMTIGTGAHVEGTIIAQTGSITFGTGATLVGRAISLTQSVTLLGNQITQPVCAATTTSTSTSSNATAPNPPCPTIELGVIAPIIIESKRVDADSIFLSWGPYSGTDKFNVRYGTTKDNLIYNVDVTGFSTTIGYLPANQPIWVQVAARNECQIGTYEAAMLIGGPRLPNTGYGKDNSTWYVLGSVILTLGIFFVGRSARRNISEFGR